MKKYLLFLLIFASCQKQEAPVTIQDNKPIIDTKLVPNPNDVESAKAQEVADRRNPPRPPKPIKTFPNNNIAALVLIDTNGHAATGAWAQQFGVDTLYHRPAGITAEAVNIIMYEARMVLDTINVNFTLSEAEYQAYTGKKTRCVITADAYYPASGVAFRGSMALPNSEVYVFIPMLYGVTNWIRKIVVHELGHAMGLAHQSAWVNCVKTAEYRDGMVMGVHWNFEGSFAIGPTSESCTTLEDGIPVMAAMVGYRPR